MGKCIKKGGNQMRKIVILGICAAFMVGFLSLPPVMAAPVTLRFSDWHLTEDVWNKSLNEGMAIFHKRYPNIKVTLEPVSYGEKETKYTVESAAGRAPDVFHVHAFSLPMFFGKGYAKDLTPFIEKEGPGFLDAWYPLPIKLMKYKGKIACYARRLHDHGFILQHGDVQGSRSRSKQAAQDLG
jgi:ABC-type glycerol-3-phosphate transport system substrate-binding protein